MWRWVGTLGRLKNLSQTAHRLLLEFNPASFVSRHLTMLAVPAPGIDVITANYPPKKQEKALACTALSGWSIR